MALIGISSRFLWDVEKTLIVNLDYISKCADCAEIWMMPPFFPSWRTPSMKGDIDKLKDALSVSELKTTIHCPHHDLNLASLNPAAASTAVREVEKCLEVADYLGSSVVTFHPGHFKYPLERRIDMLRSHMSRLNAKAKEHNALLCLENMAPANNFCTTSSEVLEVIAGMDRINVTLDLAHALSEDEDIYGYVRSLGERIRHIHISDFKDGKHPHLPLGNGELKFDQAFAALKTIGYGGIFMIEGEAKNPYEVLPRELSLLRGLLTAAGL
jgi:sugar phosphate isomerase/epimerase